VCQGRKLAVMMRCAADSALSEQRCRQFSATAACTERQNILRARRKSCNDVKFCAFREDATAYAVGSYQALEAGADAYEFAARPDGFELVTLTIMVPSMPTSDRS
jgi:hypothetical protein